MRHNVSTFHIIGLVTLLSSSAVFASQHHKPHEYSDNKKAIISSPSQPEFLIRLKSNPTTGYSWYIKRYNHKLIRVMNYQFVKPDSHEIGASGSVLWTFRVVPEGYKVPNITEIELVYARPWDIQNGETKVFTVATHKCHPSMKKHSLQHITCA